MAYDQANTYETIELFGLTEKDAQLPIPEDHILKDSIIRESFEILLGQLRSTGLEAEIEPLAHGLATLLGAAERLRDQEDLEVLLIGDGADRVLQIGEPFGETRVAHDGDTVDHVRMAVQVFGRRVHDHIGAQVQWALKEGRQERVVRDRGAVDDRVDVGQEVAQRVLTDFIEGREEDRIGLVIFRR